MKLNPSNALALALLLALLASMPGCGASPIQKVSAAEQLYTSTANSLAESVRGGLITDQAQLKVIRAAAVEADTELDAAKDAALAGDPLKWPFAWSRASKALDRFLIYYAKTQRK